MKMMKNVVLSQTAYRALFVCKKCRNVAIQKTVRMKNTIGKERSKMLSLALTILMICTPYTGHLV